LYHKKDFEASGFFWGANKYFDFFEFIDMSFFLSYNAYDEFNPNHGGVIVLTVFKAKEKIQNGECDSLFQALYSEKAEAQKERYLSAIDSFAALFGTDRPISVFSAPGRTEIGGNHTDHNGGRVLAGSVDLDVIAICAKTEEFSAQVHSKGFAPNFVALSDLEKKPEEEGKSAALVPCRLE
jgi:galactokinase